MVPMVARLFRVSLVDGPDEFVIIMSVLPDTSIVNIMRAKFGGRLQTVGVVRDFDIATIPTAFRVYREDAEQFLP